MQVHNIDHANAVAFLLAAALLGLACPGQCSVYHGAAAATKTSRPAGGGPHRPGGALPASRLVSLTKSVVATLRYRPRSPGNCEAVFPDHGTPVPTPEGLLDCAITGDGAYWGHQGEILIPAGNRRLRSRPLSQRPRRACDGGDDGSLPRGIQ